VASGAFRIENRPVQLHIADIEQLIILQPILTACFDVWLDIIKLAEFPGELNMCLVGEVCPAENDNAVLETFRCQYCLLYFPGHATNETIGRPDWHTFVTAVRISLNWSFDNGSEKSTPLSSAAKVG
jgi:hypothetical protein